MNKIHFWIKNHRARWCLILFVIGASAGVLMNVLLGGGFMRGVVIALIYGFFLVIVELIVGGSGVPDYST